MHAIRMHLERESFMITICRLIGSWRLNGRARVHKVGAAKYATGQTKTHFATPDSALKDPEFTSERASHIFLPASAIFINEIQQSKSCRQNTCRQHTQWTCVLANTYKARWMINNRSLVGRENY